MKYTACIQPEEIVLFFGQGETPEAAIDDFLQSGELQEYKDYYELSEDEILTVEVFNTLYEESWDDDMESTAEAEGFKWFLGKKVAEKELEK